MRGSCHISPCNFARARVCATGLNPTTPAMTCSLVLYYSIYVHVETLASATTERDCHVDDCEITPKRVPDTMPP